MQHHRDKIFWMSYDITLFIKNEAFNFCVKNVGFNFYKNVMSYHTGKYIFVVSRRLLPANLANYILAYSACSRCTPMSLYGLTLMVRGFEDLKNQCNAFFQVEQTGNVVYCHPHVNFGIQLVNGALLTVILCNISKKKNVQFHMTSCFPWKMNP